MSESRSVWIVEIGEPLPLPGATLRLMRAGQIAERLQRLGAELTWWVSDFDHSTKCRYDLDGVMDLNRAGYLANGVFARFLHGRPYARNVSLGRILHNRDVARDFISRARALPAPDAIMCCYPTIDLALAATKYGEERGVPVVLDIRDLWPDAFVDVSPLPKPLTRALIAPMDRQARRAIGAATAISAISEPILNWALTKAGRARSDGDHVVPLSYERPTLNADNLAASEAFWRRHGLKLDGSEHIACFFGNLSSAPELETAIEAIDHLPKAIREGTRIVICGAGERLDWLREQSAQRAELLAPGRVGGNEIATLMRHAKAGLLIYPSRPDFLISYPNKVGEYLSAGLPILSTVDGLTGCLLRDQDCGLIVPNGAPKALAAAFAELVTNELSWRRKSDAALRVFARLFDADKVYGHTATYLLSLGGATSRG
jgi:glycosyltransferase involved in cell wall biosynthesis